MEHPGAASVDEADPTAAVDESEGYTSTAEYRFFASAFGSAWEAASELGTELSNPDSDMRRQMDKAARTAKDTSMEAFDVLKEQVSNPDSTVRRHMDEAARVAKEKSIGAFDVVKEQVSNPDSTVRRHMDEAARVAKEKSIGAFDVVKEHVESSKVAKSTKRLAKESIDAVSPYVAEGMVAAKDLTKTAASSLLKKAPIAIRNGAAQVVWQAACGSNPCANGGECVISAVDENEYTCLCQDSFNGVNCEMLSLPPPPPPPPPPPSLSEAATTLAYVLINDARITSAALITFIGTMITMRTRRNANDALVLATNNKPKTARKQAKASKPKPRTKTSRSPSPVPPKRKPKEATRRSYSDHDPRADNRNDLDAEAHKDTRLLSLVPRRFRRYREFVQLDMWVLCMGLYLGCWLILFVKAYVTYGWEVSRSEPTTWGLLTRGLEPEPTVWNSNGLKFTLERFVISLGCQFLWLLTVSHQPDVSIDVVIVATACMMFFPVICPVVAVDSCMVYIMDRHDTSTFANAAQALNKENAAKLIVGVSIGILMFWKLYISNVAYTCGCHDTGMSMITGVFNSQDNCGSRPGECFLVCTLLGRTLRSKFYAACLSAWEGPSLEAGAGQLFVLLFIPKEVCAWWWVGIFASIAMVIFGVVPVVLVHYSLRSISRATS
eukprot:COSAG06_NODE_6075_length_3123_cov_3.098214_2_plen_665_part_00